MLAYIAFVWNDSDLTQREASQNLVRRLSAAGPRWRVVLTSDGLAVCCLVTGGFAADETYVLNDQQGVVLGKLFNRANIEETIPKNITLDGAESEAIVHSAGRRLIEKYWGGYVAFVRSRQARKTWVLRDPSGGVPCQSMRIRGVAVYFNRLQDFEQLGLPPFSINHRYLAGYLYNARCRRETGLNEVTTVLAGECIAHHGADQTASFYWNPLEIAETDVVEDTAEAVRRTRETVRACVQAWASGFESILHSLSGGLDSSIVLACLADAPTRPRITCFNNYLEGPNTDERHFAQLMAQRAGCELIERELQADFSLEHIRQVPCSAVPVASCSNLASEQKQTQLARQRNARAIFTGRGGDELFFRNGRFGSATDYAWSHGLRPALFSIALGDAELRELSLWQVLNTAMRHGLRKQRWSGQDLFRRMHRPLVKPEIKEEALRDETLIHPLFRGSPALPPGKLEQAYLIAFQAARFHNPAIADEHPVMVDPLSAQPFIELSLRIPLYVLLTGGRDRSIARYAFAEDVPREIILRKTKAHGGDWVKDTLARNIGLARELLLDGYLTREGYLDRAKVEEALSGQPTRLKTYGSEILGYLNIEAWAQNWATPRHRERSRACGPQGS